MWIEKLPSGKYKYKERYTDPMTGKYKTVSITLDKNTAQAKKMASEILNKKIADKLSSGSEYEDITLGDLIEKYREVMPSRIKASTFSRNKFAHERCKEMFGEDTLCSKLTAPYVRSRMEATDKDAKTLNEYLKRFKALIRFGYEEELIQDVSYLNKLKNFPEENEQSDITEKYLESDELKAVLDAMSLKHWRLLTEFLALSGLRIGEAIPLKISDVDFDNHHIHVTKTYDVANHIVTTPKTAASIDDVFMQPELDNLCHRIRSYMLRQQLENSYKSDLFFQNPSGELIGYPGYRLYFQKVVKEVTGKKLTPHALRHTHASLLMERGVPIEVISRRLRHANSKITKEIYLHVTKKLREQDEKYLSSISLCS